MEISVSVRTAPGNYITLTGKGKELDSMKELHITVKLNKKENVVILHQSVWGYPSISIPVEYWDRIKCMVDRLIIKADNLWKEEK